MSELIHDITLPSQGILYTESPELAGNITIRAITTKEEKLIFGSGTDSAISKALHSCVISPESFSVGSLTIPDKHFLIVAWRALSYGPEYEASGRCPVCGTSSNFVVNTQDLVASVRTLDESYAEPYEIVLPESKDTVTLRHLRDQDLTTMENQVSQLKKKLKSIDNDVNFQYDYQLAYYISTVNDSPMTLTEKLAYVNTLVGRDTSYIQHKASKIQDYGIDPFVEVSCKKVGCETSFRVAIPVDWSFFRSYFED